MERGHRSLPSRTPRHRSIDDYRRALATRMRERSTELEQEIFDRISAIEEAANPQEQGRLNGLQKVIRPAIEYGLASVELGEKGCSPPPPAVIAHARSAAWKSIGREVLSNRYLAGYSLFNDFLLREHQRAGGVRKGSELRQIFQSNAVAFERLIGTVGKEYEQEHQSKTRSPEARRLERVRGLLSGELLDAPELSYDFSRHHICLVGSGDEMDEVIRRVARTLDGQVLVVYPSPNKIWTWIGTREKKPAPFVESLLRSELPSTASASLGETASGVGGWRRSHRQAEAAFAVATQEGKSVVRYGEVALLASIIEDEFLNTSLRELYLAPLEQARDRGATLLNTLEVYFNREHNLSSTAAMLAVDRRTVRSRLNRVEALLETPSPSVALELRTALRLRQYKCQLDGLAEGRSGN
jgi:GGDEF-like domain/PucR C-terminal helix-turn-helix domain